MTPTLPTQIRKRNGQFADFDQEKIITAVQKAFFAVKGDAHTEEAQAITRRVLGDLAYKVETAEEGFIPGVEELQDLVELAIMERGFYDVAKAYIIYRFERSEVREEKQEEVREQIKRGEFVVPNPEGGTETISLEAIRAAFAQAARGFEDDVDVDALVEQVQMEVYEGMNARDVAHALVLVARSFIERDPVYATVASRLLLENIVYEDAIGECGNVTDATFADCYRQKFAAFIDEAIALEHLDERMREFDLEHISAAIEPNRDDLLKYLGTQTLFDRYFLRDRSRGDYHRMLETPQFMWMRVAMGLALVEAPENREKYAIDFYNMLSQLRFISSTPTLFHSGTRHPQLSSCYLGCTNDDLDSIFKSYRDCAQLSKYAGGIGWDWSRVRATGAEVKGNGITSNGIVPFVKIQDSTTLAINRSGRRRGAAAMYLETWHFDIEDFLILRKNTGDDRRRTHELNTVNWIPDVFMKRVRDDAEWTLLSPDEAPDLHELYGAAFEKRYLEYEAKAEKGALHIWKRVSARDLWRQMVTQLFETGHPWMTFKDSCNVRSPQDHVGVIHSSNLCTEITLNTEADEEVAVCNLGSVNLAKHIADGKLDEEKVAETVRIGMRMLDNVIDINFYPIEEAQASNMRHRPVGLGVMGLQDALYLQDITFDSEEGVAFSDYSMEVVAYNAMLASSKLAKERGTYETYEGSKWSQGILPQDTIDLLEKERGEEIPVNRAGKLDWAPVREHIQAHGIRNSNTMALAPTATISNIAGCLPTIEPIYKNIYVKANISGEFIVTNHYLIEDLKKEGLWNEEMLELIKGQEGDLSSISSIPEALKHKYKEVFAIDPTWLIRAAAQRGKWIDQSQSLNIFFKGTSGKAISDLYHYAWQMGLKTTYYLRTLAASAIEKSTVSLANQNTESVADKAREDAMKAVKEVKEKVAVERGTAIPQASSAAPKLCKIEDPSCESCQ